MAKIYANSNLTPTQWANATWKESQDRVFWQRFVGTSELSPIVLRPELNKNPGDTIKFGFTMQLDGAGVTSGVDLEGNEETFDEYMMQMTVDELCNGVRIAGFMEEQKQADNLRLKAKQLLRNWVAVRQDTIMFNQMSGDTGETFANTPSTPDTTHLMWGGDATSKLSLSAGDTFTTQEIDRLVYTAQTLDPIVRPYRVKGGMEGYVCVIHPRNAYTLWDDAAWINANQAAYTGRGDEMPFFKRDAFFQGFWNSVAVYSHPSVKMYTDYGASSVLPASRVIFFGAQAAVMARIQAQWWREKTFDYGRQHGFAVGGVWGFKKARFNSKDLGCILMDCSAPAPAGSDHA